MKTPEGNELKRLMKELMSKKDFCVAARGRARELAEQYSAFCLKQREKQARDVVSDAVNDGANKPVFRDDYAVKLRVLGVWDRFVYKYMMYKERKSIEELNSSKSFHDFVYSAFPHDDTHEESNFWAHIANS